MASQDLTLKIKTEYDGKGSAAATKAVDDLGKATEKAGRSQESAGKQSQQFGQATGRAAEMVGSLTGAMGQASPAAARLGAGLRVIKSLAEGSAGGLMGIATVLVGIGVSAWASYQKKVEESRKKLQEFMADLTDRKIETGARRIDAISDSFGRVEKAISSARAAQSELVAAWEDLNRAGQEVTTMEIDRREKAALARVSPGDQAGASAVRARYAGLRESAALGARAAGAIRAEQAAQDDLAAASGRRANIEQTLGTSVSARDLIAAQLSRSTSRADIANPDAEDRENAAKEVAAFTAQLARLDKQVGELTDALASARTGERAAGIRVQAAGLRATRGIDAASALADQNTSDAYLSAARARESSDIASAQSAAADGPSAASIRAARGAAQRNVLSAERALRTARNSGNADAVAAALERAAAAQAERDRIIIADAEKRAEQANRAAEAIKNLPNN